MRSITIVCLLVLASCSSEAESLERQYEMVSGRQDKCRVAAETRDAFLREENREKYRKWRSQATWDCYSAQFP